jgi:quercetin dioxygenase-like cupin family protein
MQVTNLADARPYQAPKHHDMIGLRLHGFDATDTDKFWVGLSHFLPGGGAERDATPTEKVYIVVDGAVTVTTDAGERTLGPLDSVHLGPGEARSVENRTNKPASMLVVMTYPEATA